MVSRKQSARAKEKSNMKAQDLKNSILQLAIQGKLVPQDANDEPAEVLYAKIQAEKQKLIKEGKIKKDKPLPPITEDEIPFEIPSTWKWVRLGDIFNIVMGQSPDGDSVSHVALNGIEFHQGKSFFSETYLLHSDVYTNSPTKIVENNTNILCVRAPVGIVNITERKVCIGRGLCGVVIYNQLVVLKLLFYFLQSMENDFNKKSTGTTFKAITGDVVSQQLFPLPPLAEQKRIVAKIEELEPLVKRYDKAETELSVLNDSFPEQLKKSILQYAIQGKLVAQNVNDEPAEVLYAKIQAEKQKLIKEGKIKKDKPLPLITDEEIPFAIPPTWKWVRLGSISNYSSAKKKISPNQIEPEMWSLDLEDIEKGTGRVLKKCFAKDRIIRGEKVCFTKGNILYSKLRPYLLKILIADDDGITTPELVPFNFYGDSYQQFFLWYLKSPYVDSIVNSESYGVKMPRVGTDTMLQLLVPLPPLAEQHRIVAKVTELMQYCEKLKS